MRRSGVLQLLCLTACLAFAGYMVSTVVRAPNWERILVWFVGAAIVHDLVLWPVYTVLNRAAARASRHPTSVPWINHVRVPAVLSAVTLLISFPLVLRHSELAYHNATGLTEHPYLGRWLLVTGSAFAISAGLYIARLLRGLRSHRTHT
jgi:Kef-type K+ transport system membrane component KefB